MLSIRAATLEDIARITEIYAHYVLHSVATFEEIPPTTDDMRARFADIATRGLPWLVGTIDGTLIGYAYAGPYKARAAYRFTVENSVYLDAPACGKGYGRQLLAALIEACTAQGLRCMVAHISGDTPASVALHAQAGFTPVGILARVGYKFDRWLDVTIMSRPLP